MHTCRLLALTLLLITSGPAWTQSAPASSESRQPGFAAMQDAREAFEDLLRAYERGDISAIERQLDADMIGRGRMMDALRRDASNLRNLRVHLADVQMTAGPDVAVLNLRWEKRFLAANDLQPGQQSGRSVILMHRAADGWRMASISGDNLFGGPAGALGNITVSPSPIPLTSLPLTAAVYAPFILEVSDADLVGRTTLTVEISSPQGERETLTLASVGPGRFRNTTGTSFHSQSAPAIVMGNNIVEVFGATTLSIRYLDQSPGNNRPPTTLTKRVAVQ